MLAGSPSVSLAAGSEEQIHFSQHSPKMLKMASESFILTLLMFLGLFLKISRWVPLMSLVSLTDSDTAIVPRIGRELQTTRCFCKNQTLHDKIDDIIVWKALASVCLLIFSHRRVSSRKAIETKASRKAIETKARDEERVF